MATKNPKTVIEQADVLSQKLESLFVGSLPALPDSVKELIVKVGPYVTLVMMLMLLPVIVAGLGLGAVLTPFSFLGGVGTGFSFVVSMIFAFGRLILNLMALPGLFKRKKRSWKLVYYATLLSLLDDLFTFRLGGLIVSTLISFYFLFQVKAKYTQ